MNAFSLFQNSPYHAPYAAKLHLFYTSLQQVIASTSHYPAYTQMLRIDKDLSQRIFQFCWSFPLTEIDKQIDMEQGILYYPMLIYAHFLSTIMEQYKSVLPPSLLLSVETLPDVYFIVGSFPNSTNENIKQYLGLLEILDKFMNDPKAKIRHRITSVPQYRQSQEIIPYLLQGMSNEGILSLFLEKWQTPEEKMPSRPTQLFPTFFDYATKTPPVGWEDHFKKCAMSLQNTQNILHRILKHPTPLHECKTLCPPFHNIFNVFEKTPLPRVRVVIIGQDPYHDVYLSPTSGKEEIPCATGLAFSLPSDFTIFSSRSKDGKRVYKKSIDVILDEVKSNYPNAKFPSTVNGNLEKWAERGVFLLNASLTTIVDKANAHQDIWTDFVQRTIDAIVAANPKTIFLLWGNKAQWYDEHYLGRNIIRFLAPHPSPMNTGVKFSGCEHFKKVNAQFDEWSLPPIDWSLA